MNGQPLHDLADLLRAAGAKADDGAARAVQRATREVEGAVRVPDGTNTQAMVTFDGPRHATIAAVDPVSLMGQDQPLVGLSDAALGTVGRAAAAMGDAVLDAGVQALQP